MPLLDGFTVDYTYMAIACNPYYKNYEDTLWRYYHLFDLCFCRPNLEVMLKRGIHTLEHLFAGFMRNHLNGEDVNFGYLYDGLPYLFLYEPYWRAV